MSAADVQARVRLDVVVVGAGLAGLAAARALNGRHVLLLEAEDRVGGRLMSRPAGDYWLNFGAHMIGGPDSKAGQLVHKLGLTACPIRGRLMGLVYRGRRFLKVGPELYPMVLPLSARERLSFCRMGYALRLGAARFERVEKRHAGETDAVRRARLRSFENHRTLSDFIGPLEPEIVMLLRTLTERTGADPSVMSAGHGLRSFANVWSRQAPSHTLIGGSSLLAERIRDDLDAEIGLDCRVVEVVDLGNRVRVSFIRNGSIRQIEARVAIIATPSQTARGIVRGLSANVAAALSKLRAGPFLTAAVLTNETGPMPWDGIYAVATPNRSFSVMFNMAAALRVGDRRPGGSLMLFRGARGATELMQTPEREIEQRFLADLLDLFPEANGIVREIEVHRWEVGAPYSIPGSAEVQTVLDRPLGRIVLAGDYLDFPNIEAAIASGIAAAHSALNLVDDEP